MANEQRIEHVDPNMIVDPKIKEPDVQFYDVREEPFKVYGLYNYREEPDFKRMPDDVAKSVNDGVAYLYLQTAGGRVRFSTDSQYVGIRAIMPYVSYYDHMPMTGSSAFDLYVDEPETGISRFHRSFRPDFGIKTGYEALNRFPDRKLRHFTIHFPTYSNVRSLQIALQKDATLGEGMKYLDVPPIVYYGSSITQGGCASRPGNTYQSVLSQRLNIDHINLGFSGNGKGEDSMVDYMASLKMSAFVSDYDHNAPNVEHLRNTHCKMYQKIRAAHPDIPYIMLSRPDFDSAFGNYDDNILRRNVIYDTYRYARQTGDKNVYFIDGESIFRGKYSNMCTVDGSHPTDLGFALMADTIEAELRRALTQHLFD